MDSEQAEQSEKCDSTAMSPSAEQQNIINPFDSHQAENLSRPFFSPSIFAHVVSPSYSETPTAPTSSNRRCDRGFRWSIDAIAVLNPADIEENALCFQACHENRDENTEARFQAAIDEFFAQHGNLDSPWAIANGRRTDSESEASTKSATRPAPLQLALLRSEQKQLTHPRQFTAPSSDPTAGPGAHQNYFVSPLCALGRPPKNVSITVDTSSQTMYTFPPDFDLATVLGKTFVYEEDSNPCGSGVDTRNSTTGIFSRDDSISQPFTRTVSDPGNLSISGLRRKLFACNSQTSGESGGNKNSMQNSFAATNSSSSSTNLSMNNTSQADQNQGDNDVQFAVGAESDGSSMYLLSSSPLKGVVSPPLFFNKGSKRTETEKRFRRASGATQYLNSPELSPIHDIEEASRSKKMKNKNTDYSPM